MIAAGEAANAKEPANYGEFDAQIDVDDDGNWINERDDTLADLPRATAFIGKDSLVSVYQWLKLAYGFREEKVKPYTFNPAPFIADKASIQQGYITAEPFEVERQGFPRNFTHCNPCR